MPLLSDWLAPDDCSFSAPNLTACTHAQARLHCLCASSSALCKPLDPDVWRRALETPDSKLSEAVIDGQLPNCTIVNPHQYKGHTVECFREDDLEEGRAVKELLQVWAAPFRRPAACFDSTIKHYHKDLSSLQHLQCGDSNVYEFPGNVVKGLMMCSKIDIVKVASQCWKRLATSQKVCCRFYTCW